jgi:hypothetical protein
LAPLLDRLADARVDQRRFPADVGADQQDRIGVSMPAMVVLKLTADRLDTS